MDVQKLKNESGLKGPNSSEMASALRNFGQAASNNIAETVSTPIDAIAWALRKAGVPVGNAPVMGSEWMAQKGLTRPTQEGVSKMAGDFVGLVSPLAFEKQVASKLAGALRNVKPSAGLSTEAVGGMDFLKPADYRMSHTSPGPEFGAPLHDLTGGGQMYPADVYSAKAAQYYGTGYPSFDREAFSIAHKAKGNPEAEVTMYRAVPKGVSAINAGDWVTLSKGYAKNHGESVLDNAYDILEQKVKARDLWTNADSIHEFGYHPQGK